MATKKPTPPPITTAHPPSTPPPTRQDEEATGAGNKTPDAEAKLSSPATTTPPGSPGYLLPTFSSEQHAKKSEPHVCLRCHPECIHGECDEHGMPVSPTRTSRRRSSAASRHHHEVVKRHLGMEGKEFA